MEKQIKNQNSADALCINLLSDIYEYIENDKDPWNTNLPMLDLRVKQVRGINT